MPETHDPYAALRFPNYRCLLGGGILAGFGSEIQALAVGWDLYVRTESPAALGMAGLAQFLPVLLLSLPAGQAADRYSRRLLFQLAQSVMALGSLGLAALSVWEGPVPLIYLCLVLTGCSRALSSPARVALIPQVVPQEALGNAITWHTSGWQIANVTGPAIGGLAIALSGEAAAAYLLAALCSFTSAGLLIPIRLKPVPRRAAASSFGSLLAGVRFVARTRLLLAAITLDLFAVLLGGATALLPIYARDILHVGPTGLGWLRASPALGAFVMAMVLAHRPPLARPGLALLFAVTGFGAATIIFGLATIPALSFLMLALTGAFDNISVVVRHTLVQVLTPDEMRGRVAAVNVVFISSSNELGAFESGLTAEAFGPIASVVGGGIGTILVVVAAVLCWPQLARLGPLHRLSPPPPREEEADLDDVDESAAKA